MGLKGFQAGLSHSCVRSHSPRESRSISRKGRACWACRVVGGGAVLTLIGWVRWEVFFQTPLGHGHPSSAPLTHISFPGEAVGTLSSLWMFAPGGSLCLLLVRSWRLVVARGTTQRAKRLVWGLCCHGDGRLSCLICGPEVSPPDLTLLS